MKRIIIIKTFTIVLSILAIANIAHAQNCEVKIVAPENGSQVDGDGLVSGNVKLPPNGYLWVFAHKVGFNGWWPQGNGAAEVIGTDWDILVYYGTKGDYGKFEVIAMVVDEQTHQDLIKWVREAPKEGYPPILLPTGIDGCNFSRIRVDKTKD